MVDPSSFTACHPGNAGAKVDNPTSNWTAKSEAIHLMSTGGLSNGQLRIHTIKASPNDA